MTKYVTVPAEPTEEMIKAGIRRLDANGVHDSYSNLHRDAITVYKAMLAAAPTTNPPEISSELVDDELARLEREIAEAAKGLGLSPDDVDKMLKRLARR